MSGPGAGETGRATGFARQIEWIAELLVDRVDVTALGELVVRAAIESCGTGAAALVLEVAGWPHVVAARPERIRTLEKAAIRDRWGRAAECRRWGHPVASAAIVHR